MKRSAARSATQLFTRSMLHAVFGSVLVFSIADQNPVYFLVAMLGVGMAWVFSVGPGRPAPRMVINSILLLVIVVAGIEMLRIGVGVNAFTIFVTLLMIVKLLDLRTPRDDGQVIVLCVAILIAAVLTSNSLMTGILMLLAIALILRAVVLYQIHDVLERADARTKSIGQRARIDIRSMILATGFLCAIIGSAVFVVLPRNIGTQAFGQWGNGESVSGFSDTVELGRPGFISQSSTPVLDLTITNRDGLNIGSEDTPPVYLRGAVLSEYDAGRWNRSPVMRAPLESRTALIPPNTSLRPRGRVDTTQWDQQFAISIRSSSNGPSYLFAPWKTVEFRVGDEPMRVGLDFERGIFIKDGIGGKLDYTVRSMNTKFDTIDFESFDRRSPVTPTPIEPEIAQLAKDILVEAEIEPDASLRPISDDRIALSVIERHLRSQYTYTLDAQPVPPGEDATKWFLFERRAGHCEYYASALALMSRSIGIPVRVLTGYIVSDYNAMTGQYVVRESNAHAWVEAEIAPGHWRIFDGTPPAVFHSIHEPDPSLWRSMVKMYESVEFLWVRSVVGYDSAARQNIVGSSAAGFGLSGLGDSFLNRLAAGRGQLVLRGAIVAGVVFSISMLIGITLLRYKQIIAGILQELGALVRRVRARLGASQLAAGTDPRFDELEMLVARNLVGLGIPKPSSVPLKSHIRAHFSVGDSAPEWTREALVEASSVLYRHRFSDDPNGIVPEELSKLESKLRKSEKCIAKRSWSTSASKALGRP